MRADLAFATVEAYDEDGSGSTTTHDVGVAVIVHDSAGVIWQGEPIPRTRIGFMIGQAALAKVARLMQKHWPDAYEATDWAILSAKAPSK